MKLKPLTNKNLIKDLKKPENITNLETLLKFNKYTPNSIVSKNPIESFKKTFQKVKDFLNVEDEQMPEIEVCSYTFQTLYDVLDEKIFLSTNDIQNQTLLISHEITHYLRRSYEEFHHYKTYSVLEEGIARAVERHISKTQVNEKVLIENQNLNHIEYLQVYYKLCNMFDVKPKNEFLGEIEKTKNKSCGAHIMGNTLFALYELERGNEIYRQIMQNKFNFENKKGFLKFI